KSGFSVEGKRVVVCGAGPLLLEVARYLSSRGGRIAIIAEQAGWTPLARFGLALRHTPSKWAQSLKLLTSAGLRVRAGCWVREVEGDARVELATLTNGSTTWRVPCDYVACGFHLVPNTELGAVLGCRIVNRAVWTDAV